MTLGCGASGQGAGGGGLSSLKTYIWDLTLVYWSARTGFTQTLLDAEKWI